MPNKSYIVCVVLVLFTVSWGLLLGKDLSWDVLNHHFYLPFSWWTGRIDTDIFAAGPQSYQNPLGYFPFFFMVSAGVPSYLIGATLSAFHALNGVFAWLVAREIWPDDCVDKKTWVLLSTIAAVTTPIFLQSVGTSSVDPVGSALVIAAIWFVLRLHNKNDGVLEYLIVGVLLGLAFSIKQSNAVFVLSVGFVIVVESVRLRRVTISLLAVSGGCIGIASGMGWYSAYLYERFGNPVFPLFNNIFKSDYYPEHAVVAGRFLVSDASEYFYRIFQFAEMKRLVYFEGFMPDIRPGLLVVTAGFFVALSVLGLLKNRPVKLFYYGKDFLLFVILVVSYILWMATSGNGRYAIPFFILSGILLVRLLYVTFPVRFSKVLVSIILLTQIFYTSTAADMRFSVQNWGAGPYFDIQTSEELVNDPYLHVSLGVLSFSFLANALNKEGALINIAGQYSLPVDGPLGQEVDNLLAEWDGRTRVVGNAFDTSDLELVESVENSIKYMLFRYALELDASSCYPIELENEGLVDGTITAWLHRNNQFVASSPPVKLFSCELLRHDIDSIKSDKENMVDAVFDVIEKACPRLYGPPAWLSERTEEYWWRYYANTDAIVKVFDDQVLVQHPRSPVDRVVGNPLDILNGIGDFDCSQWDMLTPD